MPSVRTSPLSPSPQHAHSTPAARGRPSQSPGHQQHKLPAQAGDQHGRAGGTGGWAKDRSPPSQHNRGECVGLVNLSRNLDPMGSSYSHAVAMRVSLLLLRLGTASLTNENPHVHLVGQNTLAACCGTGMAGSPHRPVGGGAASENPGSGCAAEGCAGPDVVPGNDSGGGGASRGWWWGCLRLTENSNTAQPCGSPWGLIADSADDWKIKAEHVRRVQRDVTGCGHRHHGPVDRERADRGHEQPLRRKWQPDHQRDDQYVREERTG